MKKRRAAPAVLELGALTVRREAVILDAVSWRVARGEHWAVLGPNGSGKTTLLSALAGYATPGTGRMRVLGESYGRSDWRELRARIGIVSTSVLPRVDADEPAVETVASGRGALFGLSGPLPKAERVRALALLRSAGVGRLAGRAWGTFSQGERQRVFICRALMARPALLLLDEPCAGLDPAARESFLEMLQRLALRRGGPSIILATHHIEEIMPAFTHVLVLKSGRVSASGEKGRVLTDAVLSRAFGVRLRLGFQSSGRYALDLGRRPSR